jgi:hypothetical protein
MLIEVPVGDGELTARYVSRGVDWLGAAATWLALLLVALLVAVGRWPGLGRPFTRLQPLGRLACRVAPWAATVAGLAGVAMAGARLAGGLDSLFAPGSLARRLPSAQVEQAGRACEPSPPGHFACSRANWNRVEERVERFGGAFRPCAWAHPPASGTLAIRFPEVPLGDRLEGGHGLADSAFTSGAATARVELEVRIGGSTVATLPVEPREGWQPVTLDTSAWSGQRADVELHVRATQSTRAHYGFDLGVR